MSPFLVILESPLKCKPMKFISLHYFCIFLLSSACGNSSDPPPQDPGDGDSDVVAVSANGSENNYTFSVTIMSPDKGCEQYADWWEVISEDGSLLYRRILAHSHVNEQPFKRSGGPVAVSASTTVWVRSHMNNTGYGGDMFKGSVEDGFTKQTPPENFASSLEDQEPLPSGCAF